MTGNLIKTHLEFLSVQNIQKYLVTTGWVNDGEIWSNGSIWHRPEAKFHEAEIVLPAKEGLKDYLERLSTIIQELASIEQESAESIIKKIGNITNDLVTVRVIHFDVNEGTIPIDDGVMLYEHARDLMSAAALSTISKQKYFSGAKPPEALDYLKEVRFGQTEVGSYIVNVISPVEQKQAVQEDFEKTTFTRLVTETLAKSLNALNLTLKEFSQTNTNSLFDSLVEQGVSANLCDALVGLSGVNKNRDFEISLSASKLVPHNDNINLRLKFDSTIVAALEKASEYYKDNYVILNITLSGVIKKLTREKDEENGFVTIITSLGDITKSVTFELTSEHYIAAIDAHKKKTIISCTGDLHVAPRSAKLLNNNNFIVHANPELFD